MDLVLRSTAFRGNGEVRVRFVVVVARTRADYKPIVFIFLVVPAPLDGGRFEGLANLQCFEYASENSGSVIGNFSDVPMAVG